MYFHVSLSLVALPTGSIFINFVPQLRVTPRYITFACGAVSTVPLFTSTSVRSISVPAVSIFIARFKFQRTFVEI